MHDYGGDISENPRPSLKGLLSLRSYSLAVQKLCSDGCKKQAKCVSFHTPHRAITLSWKTLTFHFIAFKYVLLIPFWMLSRALSGLFHSLQDLLKNPSMEVLSLQSSFHPSSISLLYPTNPGWPGSAYVCPMNESIFSFQHCLNFQLKMSRVSPDSSEGPSITRPQPVPPQTCVSATIFLWSYFIWRQTHTQSKPWKSIIYGE